VTSYSTKKTTKKMTIFCSDKLQKITTPFYYYDSVLLEETLNEVKKREAAYSNYEVHYAVKANANNTILQKIQQKGFGADCVSGGEILAAIEAGFSPNKIVFAGVGKSDWEINVGLDQNIFCFNVESIPELLVINELATAKQKKASIAIRLNPDVKADTHANISTGQKETKFGIYFEDMDKVLDVLRTCDAIELIGIHFHIGSQILKMDNFVSLCQRINQIQDHLEQVGVQLKHINVGGGLGINYTDPEQDPIPNFADYFAVFNTHLHLRDTQKLHFELGRSIVAQCGSLISKVLYIKEGVNKKFAILDAGMTELIRPALYQAYHKIENISNPQEEYEEYDVVGPICESSDVFNKNVKLNVAKRGDLIAIRSAGAYGEVMASGYNCRTLPKSYFSEEV